MELDCIAYVHFEVLLECLLGFKLVKKPFSKILLILALLFDCSLLDLLNNSWLLLFKIFPLSVSSRWLRYVLYLALKQLSLVVKFSFLFTFNQNWRRNVFFIIKLVNFRRFGCFLSLNLNQVHLLLKCWNFIHSNNVIGLRSTDFCSVSIISSSVLVFI